jgi:hypothetical protein
MNDSRGATLVRKQARGSESEKRRTSIGIRKSTKDKLDKTRAPGQCYDGFIWQMVDLWERKNGDGNN